MRWRIVLWTAIAAFAAGFGSLSVLRHLAFNTGRFDLGNMVQAVWSTAHGDVLAVTGLQGQQFSRLGAHFDPILAAFAPLWWLWPDPAMLLVVQAIAIALGAIPVYLLARKHLGSERAGVGFALAYLLYPSTQWLALNEFHPVALATPLLLAAFWFLDEDRLVPFAVAAAAACLTKEHVGLTVAAIGLWYAFARGRRKAGLVIAAAGTAVAAIAIGLVVPHFAPAGSSPFEGRYREVGGGPLGIAETLVDRSASRPRRDVRRARRARTSSSSSCRSPRCRCWHRSRPRPRCRSCSPTCSRRRERSSRSTSTTPPPPSPAWWSPPSSERPGCVCAGICSRPSCSSRSRRTTSSARSRCGARSRAGRRSARASTSSPSTTASPRARSG